MKKLLSVIAAAAVLIGSTIAYASASEPFDESAVEVYANTIDVDDQAALLRYYELEDGTLRVNAPQYSYQCDILTNVVIPAEKDGKKVTEIGRFDYCRNLISVIIPDGVTSIGQQAFYFCTSLTSVIIPDSVTSIGSSAFSGCKSLASITIPDGITSIGNNTFCWCSSLTSVTIPDSVTTIGNDAFSNCTSLTSITIPDGVTDIGRYAFLDCSGLKSVNVAVENSVYFSSDGVLYEKRTYNRGFDWLVLVWYPQGKEEISYTIPKSVENIAERALSNCPKLENIYVDPNNIFYESNGGVLFSRGGEELVKYPAGRKQTHYTIPDGVLDMSSRAFEGCVNLVSVTMPERIISADFTRCTSLETINLPSSLNYMYFYDCPRLSSEIIIPENITEFSFRGCRSLTSVIIPDNITEINSEAFRDCESLMSLKMSKNVTKIGIDAFWNCKNLPSIKIPSSVTDIAYGAFGCCTNLKSISIPKGLSSIDYSVFQGCSDLESIQIPNSVEKIKMCAFMGCKNLKDVYYTGTEEQWKNIPIEWANDDLTTASIHFSSAENSPVEIDIPKPADGAPETANMQVLIKQGNNIIDTLPINDDGTLDLSGVPDGEYTFTFSADHCAPRSYTVSVSSGTVTGLEDGVELNLYGDINGDGIVDIKDVAAANKYFKTGSGLSGYMLSVSDVNGDNIIDIKDVAKMNSHFKQTGNLWQ